jgi:hypothetical protein
MKARWEGDCKVEDSFTTGTGHVAHSVNDNEEVTRTKNIDQVGKEAAGHSNGHQQKRPPKGPSCEHFVHTQRPTSP